MFAKVINDPKFISRLTIVSEIAPWCLFMCYRSIRAPRMEVTANNFKCVTNPLVVLIVNGPNCIIHVAVR